MTRLTGPAGAELNTDLTYALLMGPAEGDGLSDEDLELGWRYRGERIMEDHRGRPGTRPWGWWVFEVGEDPPPRALEAVRLAELGELTREELAALRERANEARLRIGTTGERISGGGREHGVSMDVRAVELWEAVERALGGPPDRRRYR